MWSWKNLIRRTEGDIAVEPGHDLHYLSALISAGLRPTSAWEELARNAHPHEVSYQIHDALTRGVPLARAIETVTQSHNESWRAVGAAWAIARASGAPLAPALIALSNALGDSDSTHREMQATLAGPKATLRLVFALPVLALVGGALSGVNAWGAVMSHPLGLLALGVGVTCFLGAWWWIRILTHRAMPTQPLGSLPLDLFAVSVSGSMMPGPAQALVEETLVAYGLEPPAGDEMEKLGSLSRRAGIPIARLAREHAAHRRRVARSDALRSVGELGVAVVLPLGLLVLPGFVLVAIVPMALGIWSGAGLA